MSLRFFHIVFITISTLLCLGIAWWAYENFRASGAVPLAVGASVAAFCGLCLVAYGVWFLKKTKRLIL